MGVPKEHRAIIGWSVPVQPGEWISTLNGDWYVVIEPSTKTDRTSWSYDTPVDLRSKCTSKAEWQQKRHEYQHLLKERPE